MTLGLVALAIAAMHISERATDEASLIRAATASSRNLITILARAIQMPSAASQHVNATRARAILPAAQGFWMFLVTEYGGDAVTCCNLEGGQCSLQGQHWLKQRAVL